MSRRGMPLSTNEGATSITVSQAQSARVWAGLLEPILGVQFRGLGKWQPHSYSNQRRHSESFSFQWGRRVNRVILSGRQFCWIMEGCVLSACLTEGRWAKGATLWKSSARGFYISTADSSYGLNSNPHCFRSGSVIGWIMLLCFKNAHIVSAFLSRCCQNILFFDWVLRFVFEFRKASWGRVLYHRLKQYIWVV